MMIKICLLVLVIGCISSVIVAAIAALIVVDEVEKIVYAYRQIEEGVLSSCVEENTEITESIFEHEDVLMAEDSPENVNRDRWENCKYASRQGYFLCAVNPSGPCYACMDYESR